MEHNDNFENLKKLVQDFVKKRDWDQFHTPKNLSMALIVEAAELVECFQWLTPEECMNLPPEKVDMVAEEAADILVYLTRLTDVMGIDLLKAAFDKVKKNEMKYPEKSSSGNALKYKKVE